MPPQAFLMFILLNELTSSDQESYFGTLAMFFDASGMLILGVYFSYFRDMSYLIYFLVGVYAVGFMFMIVFIPESPKYLD